MLLYTSGGSGTLPTCECVNQFRCLHFIQVGSTIPRSCHHLSASNQPIARNHNALVTFQSCCSNSNIGDFTRSLAIYLAFLSVWWVLVIITWSLWKNTHTNAMLQLDGTLTPWNGHTCFYKIVSWRGLRLKVTSRNHASTTAQSYSHWHLVVAEGWEAALYSARCELSDPLKLWNGIIFRSPRAQLLHVTK